MSRKPLSVALAMLACALCLARPASAQMGAQDSPDLSGPAEVITKAAAPPAPTAGKLFGSGLAVPSVHPGETARGIARQMRVGIEKQSGPNPALQKLEDAMPGLLSGLETLMGKQGFAERDLGVASGFFFIGNWQTATGQTLSDPAQAAAVRAVAASASKKWEARFRTLSPPAREKTYESLLISTALLNVFAQTFDKAGKAKDAASIRQTAGTLFEKVVGLPPAQVEVSVDGRIRTVGTTATVPEAAPVARGAGVKPSQIAGVYAQPSYGGGAGGFVSVSYEPVLALKDGTYYGGFEVPPSDLDVAASRRSRPGG